MADKKQKIYLDVARAPKAEIDSWKRGVSIEAKAGESISAIFKRACVFRYRLGDEFLTAARIEIKKAKPKNRSAVGRSYYAMYHYVRAVVYLSYGGDDHEAHSNVPKKIPDDFPDRALWQNRLREARLERNRADYDPFPLSNLSYKASAAKIFGYAVGFSKVTKRYLQSKGVVL